MVSPVSDPQFNPAPAGLEPGIDDTAWLSGAKDVKGLLDLLDSLAKFPAYFLDTLHIVSNVALQVHLE